MKRVVMGLDRLKLTPCGFCFVEYYTHKDALDCMKYISGTKLDERIIRTDLDPGYKEGREFGRGRSGGQVRDEHRDTYDVGRGGWAPSTNEGGGGGGGGGRREYYPRKRYRRGSDDGGRERKENPRFRERE